MRVSVAVTVWWAAITLSTAADTRPITLHLDATEAAQNLLATRPHGAAELHDENRRMGRSEALGRRQQYVRQVFRERVAVVRLPVIAAPLWLPGVEEPLVVAERLRCDGVGQGPGPCLQRSHDLSGGRRTSRIAGGDRGDRGQPRRPRKNPDSR